MGEALLSLLTSTTIGCGVEVGVGVGSATELDGCVPGNGLLEEVDAVGGAFPEVTFPSATVGTHDRGLRVVL